VKALIPLGFESFQINFWRTLDGVDLRRLAAKRVSQYEYGILPPLISELFL
jgi:hypothetical protein